MKRLLEIGFEQVGRWHLLDQKLALELTRMSAQRNVLYAFIPASPVFNRTYDLHASYCGKPFSYTLWSVTCSCSQTQDQKLNWKILNASWRFLIGLNMQIYSSQGSKLIEVKENPFKLEKEIQELFEKNLQEVMGLTLVKSEFTIKNKRIDTLAYDEQAKAFIIIEYKRDKNVSVVDQGFTYLSLMLENKADFIIEYNEQLKKNMLRTDVDWTQTRVAFVSPSFTENQVLATNFKDIAIELWEVKRYSNGTIGILPIKKTRSAESIKPLTQQNKELKKIADEIEVYTEDMHTDNTSEEIAELYGKFKNAVLNLADDIEVKPQKKYIAFKTNKNIACFELQKKSLKIYIGAKAATLEDSIRSTS